MIKTKKQLIITISVIVLLMILSTTSYAFFNYTRTGGTNELLVGNIYFNHTQGNTIDLLDEFPEKKEVARERNDNYITLQITGLNESEKDIYYKLMLNHGDDVAGRTRIADNYLKFDLIEELSNSEERYILYNESFETINNTILVRDRIDAGTSSNVQRNYVLRMWIDEKLLISDTDEDADYTTDEYNELFASVKVTAKADTENVYYYDTFANVVTAINDKTYESNTDRANANLGIYIDSDDNSTNLVLYDDTDVGNYHIIREPININLYGYTLNFQGQSGGYTTILVFTKDTLIENGTVAGAYFDEDFSYGLSPQVGKTVMNNIYIPKPVNLGKSVILPYNAEVIIKNSIIDEKNRIQQDQSAGKQTVMHFINTEYYSEFRVLSGSKAIIDDSYFFADSPGCYLNPNTDQYHDCTAGIYNYGELIFNSGYVFGTHSGIQANTGSKTYVYGGTFESTDHGGFYFNQGPSGIAYIENANIGGIDYPANGKYRQNGTVNSIEYNGATYNLEEVRAAFYSGGSTAQNGESVYLVNCNIYAKGSEIIVVRSSTPQQNVYFSGTKFTNTNANQYIRLQKFDTMKLYFGIGNDFGLVNQVYNSGTTVPFATARAAGAIIDTNVDYKDILSPE